MAAQDIAGSRAHARGLERAGLIDQRSLRAIERGLAKVSRELAQGDFAFLPVDEDIHMAVERRLTELVGEPGQRLHTGRSRNDQVVLDLRLWCRAATCELVEGVAELQGVLLRRARQNREALLPGYTHLQRAQPVHLAHHLLAYFAMLDRTRAGSRTPTAGPTPHPWARRPWPGQLWRWTAAGWPGSWVSVRSPATVSTRSRTETSWPS